MAVFAIDSTDVLSKAAAFNETQLYEVMHGVFTPEHTPLRDLYKGEGAKVSVNSFLSWAPEYSQIMKDLGIQALTIGHPAFKKSEFSSRQFRQGGALLVSLSWGVINAPDPLGTLDMDLWRYLKSISSRYPETIFRLHPVSKFKSKKSISRLEKWLITEFPNSKLEDLKISGVRDSFDQACLHVTHRSSLFFEAALVGLPTVFSDDVFFNSLPNSYRKTGMFFSFRDFSLGKIVATPEPLSFGAYAFKEEVFVELLEKQVKLRKKR